MGRSVDRTDIAFSLGSLVAVVLIPWLLVPAEHFWKAMAVTASVAACFHGFLVWTIYRRQKYLREQVIAEVRTVLQDDIKDKLAVINFALSIQDKEAFLRKELGEIKDLIDEMSLRLDTLTEESLDEWKKKHEEGTGGDWPHAA